MKSIVHRKLDHRRGFTLVELLVAIAIIGILMGIAIPATMSAIRRARVTSIRLEITALEQAIEQYQQKYGDYPPDFSSWDVVQRHYRKLFPRMSSDESALLFEMLHTAASSAFNAEQVDRAEALVWALGGYSDDVQRPFTGKGGPLAWVGDGTTTYASATAVQRKNINNYQINSERPNALFEFDPARLNYTEIDDSTALSSSNCYKSADDDDRFLTFAAREDGAPFVYFDARTYTHQDTTLGDFNGFDSATFGIIRPLVSDKSSPNPTTGNYATDEDALKAWQFVNSNTFQIISAGMDNLLGPTTAGGVNVDGDAALEPIYFQYPTGLAIAPRTDVDTPGELVISTLSGYQDGPLFSSSENAMPDNITNFSAAEIVDDIPQ